MNERNRPDQWISENYKDIYRRFKYILKSYRVKLDHLDDVVQEYFKTILEGKSQHQTLDQFFIDYSRKQRWTYKTTPLKHYSFDDRLLRHHGSLTPIEVSSKILGIVDTELRIISLLIAKYGFDQVEIAELFGVSPARICQKIKEKTIISSKTVDSEKVKLRNLVRESKARIVELTQENRDIVKEYQKIIRAMRK